MNGLWETLLNLLSFLSHTQKVKHSRRGVDIKFFGVVKIPCLPVPGVKLWFFNHLLTEYCRVYNFKIACVLHNLFIFHTGACRYLFQKPLSALILLCTYAF